MVKLKCKILITGIIQIETGLHIGGSDVELDIGGMDNEVIKVQIGNKKAPYIPGSSLKGKLRSLIARKMGYPDLKGDKGMVRKLFTGDLLQGNKNRNAKVPTRLIVRDSYVTGGFHLEDKAENWIKRLTGAAVPRHMERVTKGARFELDMVLDVYENDQAKDLLNTLNTCFQLLTYDYLGGSGSRGYGKVSFHELKTQKLDFQQDGSLQKSNYEYTFDLMPKT